MPGPIWEVAAAGRMARQSVKGIWAKYLVNFCIFALIFIHNHYGVGNNVIITGLYNEN